MLDEDTNRQMQQYLAGMQQQDQSANVLPNYWYEGRWPEEAIYERRCTAGQDQPGSEAIVDDAKLEASEDEIKDEIKDLAKQYGMEEDAVEKALSGWICWATTSRLRRLLT